VFVGSEPYLFLDGLKHILKEHGIAKVYLLYDPRDNEWSKMNQYCTSIVEERLKDLIEIEKREVFARDYDSIFEVVYDICYNEKHKNKAEVYVDISTFSRVGMAAAISAASLFGAKVYVVVPEVYFFPKDLTYKDGRNYFDVLMSRRGTHILEIPVIKHKEIRLSNVEKDVLRIIEESGGVVTSLKEILLKLNREITPKERANISYVLKSLENINCVEKERDDGFKVKITKLGRLLLKTTRKYDKD